MVVSTILGVLFFSGIALLHLKFWSQQTDEIAKLSYEEGYKTAISKLVKDPAAILNEYEAKEVWKKLLVALIQSGEFSSSAHIPEEEKQEMVDAAIKVNNA